MTSAAVPLKFVVGSRKLLEVRRQLCTVSFDLARLIEGRMPPFPDDGAAEGYRVLSAPQAAVPSIRERHPGYLLGGFQAYRRFYIDMAGSYAEYLARFSGKTRSTLGRKRRKLAELAGGTLVVREYRSPAEIEDFLAHALPLSQRTYQTRLLDAGLPEGPEARAAMLREARADAVRAYLLFVGGEAVSYLYLPVEDGTVTYAYLGYDPAFAAHSVGTVLQMEALERLFAEQRYARFDFTEGEGAHKALFGTDCIEACSFLLLKPTLANRALIGSLDLFDAAVAKAKRLALRSGATGTLRRLLRR